MRTPMPNGRCRVVFQGYGLESCRVQALYAAWSVLAHGEGLPLTVHVYTDDPAFFAPLAAAGVELRMLSAEDIRRWKGPCRFVHRVKIEMIREMAALHPEDRLLYLDADVFAVAPLAAVFSRIGPGAAVMHEREYSVATRDTDQIRRFRRGLGRLAFRGAPVDLQGDMWNAGAVGVDPAQFPLLDRWLEFVDTLYPRYSRGIVEQYGIALLLQRATTLTPCTDEVFHYWFQKDEYVEAIGRELEVLRSRPFADAAAHLRANRLALPPPERRRHRLTLRDRIVRALRLPGAQPR
jgi:hypothetical protein